jgi:hypothetical protein
MISIVPSLVITSIVTTTSNQDFNNSVSYSQVQ